MINDSPLEIQIDITIGKNIRKYREAAGLTQQKLAKLIGFNGHASISNAESAAQPIHTKKLVLIAATLGVPIVSFINTLEDNFEHVVLKLPKEAADAIRAECKSTKTTPEQWIESVCAKTLGSKLK